MRDTVALPLMTGCWANTGIHKVTHNKTIESSIQPDIGTCALTRQES